MGKKHFDSLTELIRAGMRLRVECCCGCVSLLDPIRLLQRTMERNDSDQIEMVMAKMICYDCGKRPGIFDAE